MALDGHSDTIDHFYDNCISKAFLPNENGWFANVLKWYEMLLRHVGLKDEDGNDRAIKKKICNAMRTIPHLQRPVSTKGRDHPARFAEWKKKNGV